MDVKHANFPHEQFVVKSRLGWSQPHGVMINRIIALMGMTSSAFGCSLIQCPSNGAKSLLLGRTNGVVGSEQNSLLVKITIKTRMGLKKCPILRRIEVNIKHYRLIWNRVIASLFILAPSMSHRAMVRAQPAGRVIAWHWFGDDARYLLRNGLMSPPFP
jgi:hypothetical protein